MSGYGWTPIVRITPADGAVTTLDLRFEMAWAEGPVTTGVEHRPELRRRQDVNQRSRPLIQGFRGEVRMTFAIGGDMGDHAILAQVLKALTTPGTTVELSLDGGTSWRTVVLRDYRGPRPLGGKTFAGGQYELRLETQDLMDEVPAIGSGTW